MTDSTLAMADHGSGGRRVVLVHGALDDSTTFAKLVPLLEPEMQLLTYDRRGYGSSPLDGREPLSVVDHARDLVGLLDGRPTVVVGHSFGGSVALAAAAAAPRLVEVLVLFETRLPWLDPGPEALDAIVARRDPGAVDEALRFMLGDRFDQLPERRRARLRSDGVAFVAEQRSVRRGVAPYDLAAVRAPVLYGIGQHPVFQPMPELMAAQHLDVEVVRTPGTDHNLQRSNPEAFAALVRRGLDRRP